MADTHSKIALFEKKEVRKIWYNDEWFFSVVDVVWALTDSLDPKDYWYRVKKRASDEEWAELSTICRQLKLPASDGKNYQTDCSNTEWILRIIQSIPSPKAEPFKRRLAKVWYERVQEIEDPELAMDRMKNIYEQKWYDKSRIDKRLRWIAVRRDLTDERDNRWIQKNEYAILTAEISKATFGMTPSEYKNHKWLDKKTQNLRDHMTDLELIFAMLWEASTTEIIKTEDAKWFVKIKKAWAEWWKIAGNARKALETKTNKKIVSKDNFLPENKKLK